MCHSGSRSRITWSEPVLFSGGLVRLEGYWMCHIGVGLHRVEDAWTCELQGCLVQGPGGSAPTPWHGIRNKFLGLARVGVKL